MLNSMQSSTSQPPQGNSIIQLLQRTAIFGEKRHNVLVGNVANIDTPTYKTRDLDVAGFQQALQSAIQARHSQSTDIDFSAHPYLNNSGLQKSLDDPILAKPRNITFQDGNNRSIEQEMAELSKNKLQQSFLIQMMSAQFSQLEAVLSERV